MIRITKQTDERREAGAIECWCLHGAVGMAADFRGLAKRLAAEKTSTRAVDLWRFLECQTMPITDFGPAMNADASGESFRGNGRALLGYSMGGRLALHALLEETHPWQAAVIISADPGMENPQDRERRRAADAVWAGKALTENWQSFLTEWNAQPLFSGALPRDPGVSSAMVMRRREIARAFVDWSLGAQEPLWNRLHEISIPILWVVGESDRKFCDIATRAIEKIPRATLAIAPNAGHRVPWDAEEWLASQVAGFLRTGE